MLLPPRLPLAALRPPRHLPATVSRWYSTSGSLHCTTVVKIGGVRKEVAAARSPELVPAGYLPGGSSPPKETLASLQWMLQKDLLGQDMFLLGRPGPARRTLAQQFLELTQREMEFVSLSRDTTEADLKQRREIRAGTAFYVDQSAVRAATEGRVLVLEGIEKVERNVLPVLNNLLENREMHLEDGRLLIPAGRYDALREEHGEELLELWRLVRVSPDFRVIALGLPVPRYQGSSLDPPLRSRFQARAVTHLPFGQQLEGLAAAAPAADRETLSQLLSFAHTLLSEESAGLGLPDFPVEGLPRAAGLLEAAPGLQPYSLVTRLYPYSLFLAADGRRSVEDTLTTFHLLAGKASPARLSLDSVAFSPATPHTATASLAVDGRPRSLAVPCGGPAGLASPDYVATAYHAHLLAELLLSHSAGDICLVGPRGCGKTAVVRQLADRLGYTVETVQLYADMTARDLLQQRTTTHTGDTVWRTSPLVEAAVEGRLAVLDGLHRVHRGSLAVLQRLLHDRELQLYDGTRLMARHKFDALRASLGLTTEEMAARGLRSIHPAFRLVALAEPPPAGVAKEQWMTPEVLAMFQWHEMRPLARKEEAEVLRVMAGGGAAGPALAEVLRAAHSLRASQDASLRSVASSLSTRQLLRVARRLRQFPGEPALPAIQKACLARFLPTLAREALDAELARLGITAEPVLEAAAMECRVEGGMLTIGSTSAAVASPASGGGKVPQTLFYDTAQNLATMEALLQDFLLGEHLLLVGNQGTGKNKVVDRLLQLLNRPREYIQLNRDTTVQTLTLQPTVREGVIVYDDSPLVQAARSGNVLVVDEADKAPTNVTCILKSLVEAGEMILSDGRKIVPSTSAEQGDNIIKLHPDFRMFVLANRPGFPFLGNDFFGTLGDLFACHVVDNPSVESELTMLRQYGPSVPEDTLRRLVKAFSELRAMADSGQIHYPYSTREVVNIVRHLERFPDDGLGTVVRNVFDFDGYSKEVRDVLAEVLHKHGIPIGTDRRAVSLAREVPLPARQLLGTWEVARAGGRKQQLSVEQGSLSLGSQHTVTLGSGVLDRVEARGLAFSELQSFWSLPFHDFAVVGDVAVFPDQHKRPLYDTLHVVTANPVMLYTMQAVGDEYKSMSLHKFFDTRKQNLIPRPKLAPLGGKNAGILAVYDEVTGNLVLVEPAAGTALPVPLTTVYDSVLDLKKRLTGRGAQKEETLRLLPDFAAQNRLLFYTPRGRSIQLVDLEAGTTARLELPFPLASLHPLAEDQYLLVRQEEDDGAMEPQLYVLRKAAPEDALPSVLCPVTATTRPEDVTALDKRGLSDFGLKMALQEATSAPNTLLTSPATYATLALGFPELEYSASEVVGWPRPNLPTVGSGNPSANRTASGPAVRYSDPGRDVVFLRDSCQIVRPVPTKDVPRAGVADHVATGSCVAFLEVVDLMAGQVRYVPVPEAPQQSPYAAWYKQTYPDKVLGIAAMSADGLATVDNSGTVRLWETGVANLERSLAEWRRMIGGEEDLTLTVERPSGLDVTDPKHGKIDENNDPHVGGNQWAGGTGGRDTAGLGGKGGPYRLDAGHQVHQVPDHEKEQVPEHVQKAAREMNRKAFAEKLREIKMSEYDNQMYEQYSRGVRRQVQTLRSILDSLQAKSQDRTWLKNQTSGELDDNRLIDGLTGERSIYKKRGDQEPEVGTPQEKPKRLKLVVDVSGSMYRFNGHDQRLERMLESCLMLMEGLEGYGDRIRYDIVGHSGEDRDIPFVGVGRPPTNDKERLKVLKEMHAHSQFCMSGDHTMSASVLAIQEAGLAAEEYDDSFVVVLSDANFDRYGIRPEAIGKILNKNESVNAYMVFIGSLGNQADQISRQLPSGKSFVCLDTKRLPEILKTIFTSAMLK